MPEIMNKRGQLEIALGGLIVIGVIIFGGVLITTEKIISENRYVGDQDTRLYYDLKTCETKNIPEESLVVFESKEVAIENGFIPASCTEK